MPADCLKSSTLTGALVQPNTKYWKMQGTLFSKSISLSHLLCKRRLYGVWDNRRPVSGRLVMSGSTSGKKTTRWHRWQPHETQVLIAAKKQQEVAQRLLGVESDSKSLKKKWEEVETFCQENGVRRTAQQCRDRWERLMLTYSQIKNWEEKKVPDEASFWSMKADERRANGFLLSLDQDIYNALDELENCNSSTNIAKLHSAINDGIVLSRNDGEEMLSPSAVDHTNNTAGSNATRNDEINLSDHKYKVNVMETEMDTYIATTDIVESMSSSSDKVCSSSLMGADIAWHNVVETQKDSSIDINGRESMISDSDKTSRNPPGGPEISGYNQLNVLESKMEKDSLDNLSQGYLSKVLPGESTSSSSSCGLHRESKVLPGENTSSSSSCGLQMEERILGTVFQNEINLQTKIHSSGQEIVRSSKSVNADESSDQSQVVVLDDRRGTGSIDKQDSHLAETVLDSTENSRIDHSFLQEPVKIQDKSEVEVLLEPSNENTLESSAHFTAESDNIHGNHTFSHMGTKSIDSEKAQPSRKKLSSADSGFDDDVFVYIQSAISDAMKFISLSIKKLLKL